MSELGMYNNYALVYIIHVYAVVYIIHVYAVV